MADPKRDNDGMRDDEIPYRDDTPTNPGHTDRAAVNDDAFDTEAALARVKALREALNRAEREAYERAHAKYVRTTRLEWRRELLRTGTLREATKHMCHYQEGAICDDCLRAILELRAGPHTFLL